MHKQLWLDCDGVLADFDRGFEQRFDMVPALYEKTHGSSAFWGAVRASKGFFESLPLMPDARELYESVRHLRPIILTGCPFGGWSELQKMRWRDANFPGTPMVTCLSKHKSTYCQPSDVLVDDRDHYRHLWEQAGGTFIMHTSARISIEALTKHGLLT